ncbi:MAG: hypothetical protein R2932_33445 [Caldilineaceae bacterium]
MPIPAVRIRCPAQPGAWSRRWHLKDENGKVLIPGFYDDVGAPTEAEEVFRQNVDLEQESLHQGDVWH